MVNGKIADCLDFFRDESLMARGREICGLLGYNGKQYVAKLLQNRSPEPSKYFIIDPLDYLVFKRQYSIIAIFHSHVSEDCSASEFDKLHAENCCSPFLIFSTLEKKFGLYVPPNSETNQRFTSNLQKKL